MAIISIIVKFKGTKINLDSINYNCINTNSSPSIRFQTSYDKNGKILCLEYFSLLLQYSIVLNMTLHIRMFQSSERQYKKLTILPLE